MREVGFEGIDGAGKTTVIAKVAKLLESNGNKVMLMKFPFYDSPVGGLIRDHLEGRIKLDNRVFHALYELDRLDYSKEVTRLESEGYDYILYDRHYLSNTAFATAKGGVDMEWLANLGKLDTKPMINFILDIPVELSMKRRPVRRDIHESDIQLLTSAREAYLEQATLFRKHPNEVVYVIDGSADANVVAISVLFKLVNG